MASIDYGNGITNIDVETGIRYGVIPSNDIPGEYFEDIVQHGDDMDFEEYKSQVKVSLAAKIKEALIECNLERSNNSDDIADGIVDSMEWDGYESSGDCTRYRYERDGYVLQVGSDGDLWVLKSPYYTHAPFCSPCAPGAGNLRDGDSEQESMPRVYCLGSEWFDDDQPSPYGLGKLVKHLQETKN